MPTEEKNMDDKTAERIAIYGQRWEHARHCESERQVFMQVYVVIIAAGLALTKGEWPPPLLLFFIAALSLFGCVLSLRLHSLFHAYERAAKKFEKAHGDLDPRHTTHWVVRRIRVSRSFPIFYLFIFCFSVWAMLPRVSCFQWLGGLILLLFFLATSRYVYKMPYDVEPD